MAFIRILKSSACAFAFLYFALPFFHLANAAEQGAMPLDRALDLALEHSPDLAGEEFRVKAATAAALQTARFPNPTLGAEVENFGGKDRYNGFRNSELTAGVSQLVELPGKRSNRMQIALSEQEATVIRRALVRQTVLYNTTVAYAEALAASKDRSMLSSELDLARSVKTAVQEKVDAGKEPPLQSGRADISLETARLAAERAEKNLFNRLALLGAQIAMTVGAEDLNDKSMPDIVQPPPIDAYLERLDKSPRALMADTAIRAADSERSLEQAIAYPDPTVTLGVRDLKEDDEQAFVAGISIPIPVLNRNQSGIQRAAHKLSAAKADRAANAQSMRAELTDTYTALVNTYEEIGILESVLMPTAEKSFTYAREGYDAGKFAYLDVIDAQKTLLQVKRQHTQAVLEFQKQHARLEQMAPKIIPIPEKQDMK